MTRAWLVLLLAGCLSKPSLSNRDGAVGDDDAGSSSDGGADADAGECVPSQPSTGGLIMEQSASNGWIVRMPNGLSMTFASGATTYPFPSELTIGSEQVLAGASGGCGREQVAGIAVYPFYQIHAGASPSGIRPFDRQIVGPAVVQVRASWGYQHVLSCVNGMPRGNGHTTWTFFPDGRIVRNDYLQPVENITVGQGGAENACNCIDDTSTVITSYFAFEQSMVSTLTALSDAEGTTPKPSAQQNSEVNDRAGACFATPLAKKVGVRWDRINGQLETRVRFIVDEFAFIQDIAPSGSQPELTASDMWSARTQLLLENETSGSCTAINARLLDHSFIPPVMLSGDTIGVNLYGYYQDVDTNNMQRDRTSAVTLRADVGPVPAGSSLRVRFPGYRSITTSVPSTWQHEADDTFYVFFPGALNEEDEIVITPECRI